MVKTNVVALFISFLFLSLFSFFKTNDVNTKLKSIFIPLIFIMIGIFAIIQSSGFMFRIFDMVYSYEVGNVAVLSSGRGNIWSNAIDMYLENPIVGSGYGSFGELYGEKMDIVDYKRGAHNFYIKLLVETGLVGLSFFIILLISAGFSSIVNKQVNHIFFPLWTMILFVLFLQGMQSGKEFWLIFALIFSSPIINNSKLKKVPYEF